MSNDRLSVPDLTCAPRDLTDAEVVALRAIADVLIPVGKDGEPAATEEPGFDAALRTAIDARADAFSAVTSFLVDVDPDDLDELGELLRDSARNDPDLFQPVSAVVAGAWLLLTTVRERIGYPGQIRSVAPLDQIVDELSDGILDPVMERGYIYVDAGN
jgi:hypothetical protein